MSPSKELVQEQYPAAIAVQLDDLDGIDNGRLHVPIEIGDWIVYSDSEKETKIGRGPTERHAWMSAAYNLKERS